MKRKKNEEYKESQITIINMFGFNFHVKNQILLESIVGKNLVYIIPFYLQLFMRCRVLYALQGK